MQRYITCLYQISDDGSILTGLDAYQSIMAVLPSKNCHKIGYCKIDRYQMKIEFLGDDIGMGYGKITQQELISGLSRDKRPVWMKRYKCYYRYFGMGKDHIQQWLKV